MYGFCIKWILVGSKIIVKKEFFVLYMFDNLKLNIYFCNFYEYWVFVYKLYYIKYFYFVYFIVILIINIINW